MPYRITLTVNNTCYDVLRCRYGLHRETDTKGRPTTGLLGGTMFVQMESSNDAYILEQFLLKNEPPFCGKMEIFDEDGRALRTISWDEAHICAVSEKMVARSPLPMTMTVAISPMRLDIDRTIRLDRRWPQVDGACWREYVPEEQPVAATREEDEQKEQFKSKIKVPQSYRSQFLSDFRKIFGSKADSFIFSDDDFLVLQGKERDFKRGLSSEERKLYDGLQKVMKASHITTIIYEDTYTLTVGNSLKNVDIVEEYGGGVYSKTDRIIVISPNVGAVEVCLDVFPFTATQRVEQNTTSTLFHEIGEVITKSIEYRGDVITYENYARKILGMTQRPYDLNHSNTIKTQYTQ